VVQCLPTKCGWAPQHHQRKLSLMLELSKFYTSLTDFLFLFLVVCVQHLCCSLITVMVWIWSTPSTTTKAPILKAWSTTSVLLKGDQIMKNGYGATGMWTKEKEVSHWGMPAYGPSPASCLAKGQQLCFRTKGMGPSNHGLNSLKLWAKINLFSFKLIFSGISSQRQKADLQN
jgi:hypothetical protein